MLCALDKHIRLGRIAGFCATPAQHGLRGLEVTRSFVPLQRGVGLSYRSDPCTTSTLFGLWTIIPDWGSSGEKRNFAVVAEHGLNQPGVL